MVLDYSRLELEVLDDNTIDLDEAAYVILVRYVPALASLFTSPNVRVCTVPRLVLVLGVPSY